MSGYLKAGDTISGQEAVARMTIKNDDGTKIGDYEYIKEVFGFD